MWSGFYKNMEWTLQKRILPDWTMRIQFNFMESLARENRTVRIIDQNSEDAGLLEPYLG